MAIIARTKNSKGVHSWAAVGGNDTGAPLEIANKGGAIGTVQMTGTFGANVTLQGSLDGTNWFQMSDTGGAPLALSAAALREFSTAVRYIRPSAASGVTSVTVLVYFGG